MTSNSINRAEKSEIKERFDIHYSTCAFLDILGQRVQLKELDKFELGPHLANDRDFRNLVRDTIGRVNHLHDSLFEFFDTFNASRGIHVPDEHKQYWSKLTDIRLKLIPFSDGFFLSVPLIQEIEILPMYGVASLFHSICSTMLQQIALGTPIRGGMEIGTEVELRKNVVYGSGVAKAYELESNVAVYPRVVVGLELVNHIHQLSSLTPEQADTIPHVSNPDLYATLTCRLANICEEMMIRDFDGNIMVHFLSEYILEPLEDDLRRKLISSAFEFVVAQAEKAKISRDTKIAIKYNHIMQYYQEFGSKYVAR